MSIKVFVVEDSPVTRDLLVGLLSSDPSLEVIGTAADGVEAVDRAKSLKPDVITMDVNMPRMSGLEATRRIMEEFPLPIVIVSANWESDAVAGTFAAMEAGAVAFVGKPRGPGHPNHSDEARRLLQTVKAMAGVSVIRRWTQARHRELVSSRDAVPEAPSPAIESRDKRADVAAIAIGASTGGPLVLQTILRAIPKPFPVPILIVQHISAGFLEGLTEWLETTTGFSIKIAKHGQPLLAGHAFIAPDGMHLGIERIKRRFSSGSTLRASLIDTPPIGGLRPSVAHLFSTMASELGKTGVGVLLTGMGRDGASELKLMRDAGAVTIAQDEETSVVHGMPKEAIKLDAATYVLPPDQIANVLGKLTRLRGTP